MSKRPEFILSDKEVEKITALLQSTETPICMIAKRFGVCDSVISKINADRGIRPVGKKWSLNV